MIERKVPTTNNTEPKRPAYPEKRRPAKGPLITTSNIDRIRRENAEAAKDKKGKK